eukprot:IDg8115t1
MVHVSWEPAKSSTSKAVLRTVSQALAGMNITKADRTESFVEYWPV